MAKAPILEKIRNKPHTEKMRLIWIMTIIVVAVLVIVWIIVGQAPRPTGDTGILGVINRGWQDVKNSYRGAFNKNSSKVIDNNSTANNSNPINSGANSSNSNQSNSSGY